MGGGGIGVYVRDSFCVTILAQSDPFYDNKPEFIILELTSGKNKLLFSVVYRRPHAAYPIEFFACLTNLLPLYHNVVITGDFNMNMAKKNGASKFLSTHINASNLYLVPSQPTHHGIYKGRPSHTWLDLFIIRGAAGLISYEKSDAPFIAGHDLIEMKLRFLKQPHVSKKVVTHKLCYVDRVSLHNKFNQNFESLSRASACTAFRSLGVSLFYHAHLTNDSRCPIFRFDAGTSISYLINSHSQHLQFSCA